MSTAVCAWIVFLATEGRLLFFVLENVCGITHKRNHDAQSFAQWVIDGLSLPFCLPNGQCVLCTTTPPCAQ